MNLSQLHDLFPDADFGFSMKMRPGSAAEFFRKTESAAEVLEERKQWLSSGTSHYLAAEPESGPLVRALARMAAKWDSAHLSVGSPESSPIEPLIHLGRCWEPDVLLLAPNQGGRFILQAGCVCFPSSWALQEKLGQPLEVIHGVVPGLNLDVGNRIQTFLTKMKPGAGWFRSNWGISSSPERNQHPSRRVNRLGSDTRPQSTWVRIEHQVLTPLDDGDGILFGIRLEIVAMPEFRRDPVLRAGLSRALATMPDAMAEYKNLQRVRPALLSFLNEGSET
jgi:hypothetical protein